MENTSLGLSGESLAAEFLIGLGYKIVERNYRRPWGEIDIIALAPDQTLVFCEVKTLKIGPHIGLVPEDNVTKSKLVKTKRACETYARTRSDLVNENRGWRIDVITISLGLGEEPAIKHYTNV